MKKKWQELDAEDPLSNFRDQFYFSETKPGRPDIYLCGNSLGLQPKKAKEYILEELSDWARFGVEGHFHAKHPWLPYHEFVAEPLSRIVGAQANEVVAMNSLTVNLHLLMISFYRPTAARNKILIEANAFPSDQYLVQSQAKLHGYRADDTVLQIPLSQGSSWTKTEDVLSIIDQRGHEIAVLLLGGVNYLSGQAFDLQAIATSARKKGIVVGLDLAHAAGNILLQLHDWEVDFAAWCSYKYLNSGPGAIAGAFVHERHHKNSDLPRLAGWWGHNKATRFVMPDAFDPIPSVEAWQLSNPPIFQLAALRSSMDIFDAAGMQRIRDKSISLTQYLLDELAEFPSGFVEILTPIDPKNRGAQLSLRFKHKGKEFVDRLLQDGIICDFRSPDVIRIAPTALYNSFKDCNSFVEKLVSYAK